ncbi:MAG: addiction module protein [Planctomycetaceae bacterium]
MNSDLTELQKLPVNEKLRIVEVLWDNIAATPDEIQLSESHFVEAQRRSDLAKADASNTINRDELWRRVNG